MGSAWGNRVLSRSFTSRANGDSRNSNENQVDNKSNTSESPKQMIDKWLRVRELYGEYNNKFSDTLMDDITGLSRDGKLSYDTKFESIKTILTRKCEFDQADAGLMSKWFLDNFTVQEAPKCVFTFVLFNFLHCVLCVILCFLFCMKMFFWKFRVISDFFFFVRICVCSSGLT